jgi:hypothetical protein
MGLIDLGNRSYGDYKNWLASPAGQQASQAEAQQRQQRQASGDSNWYSSDGMVHPPAGWNTQGGSQQGGTFSASSAGQQPSGAFRPGQAQPSQAPASGTPYSPQQGQPFGAWAPQQPPASWGQPIHGQQGGSAFPRQPPPQVGPGIQYAPGFQPSQGPMPGTTMFRPPMIPTAPPGQFGQRGPITQGPAQRPGGITQSQIMERQFGDFWGQAQQMFPGMNPMQQQEMARFMKNQQESQNRSMIDQARQAGMNQWHADQAAAGQNIQDIGPGYRTNAKNRRR